MTARVDRARLRAGAGRDEAIALFETGLAAVDPERLIDEALSLDGRALRVGGERLSIDGGSVWVLAIGKASAAMARAAEFVLGRRLAGGLAIAPHGAGGATGRIPVVEAGHPLPDEDGRGAAERIVSIAGRVRDDDIVLCLLSGGGSALLASPPSGVTIADLASVTGQLLGVGTPIDEINTVRRHLSTLQGGGLARLLHPARVRTLVLSDVVGSRPESIASGPTVPDPTTFADAERVLRSRGLWGRLPGSVRRWIDRGVRGEAPETAKPGDPIFERAKACVLADVGTFLDAVSAAAARAGFAVDRLDRPITGEARAAGRRLGRRLAARADGGTRRSLLIGGGETTVTVRGRGRGGRNQEVALAAAIELRGLEGVCLAALGTDGIDGPTDAAGALIDGTTVDQALAAGLDPSAALAENDAYALLAATGDLLVTGPTGTNVADVTIGIVDRG